MKKWSFEENKILYMLPIILLSLFLLLKNSQYIDILWIRIFCVSFAAIFINVLFYKIMTEKDTHFYRLIMFSSLGISIFIGFIYNYYEIFELIKNLSSGSSKACNTVGPILIVPAAILYTLLLPGNVWGFALGMTLIGLVWLGASLSLGKAWCSWVCFFGGIDDLSSNIGKKTIFSLKNIEKKWMYLPHAILLVLLLISIVGLVPETCSVLCPLESVYNSKDISLSSRIFKLITIVVIFGAFFIFPFITKKRTFCSFLCPVGALQTLTNKLSIFKFKINKKTCNKCDKCIDICPTFSIDKEAIAKGYTMDSCNKCFRCVEGCPQKAISLSVSGNENLDPKLAKTLFIFPAYLFYTIFASVLILNAIYYLIKFAISTF